MSWWALTPAPALSQGDVIPDVPVAVVRYPVTGVKIEILPGTKKAWVEVPEPIADHNGVAPMLARGSVVPVLVLTDSCQLDKRETKDRVIVAPVLRADRLPPQDQERIWAQTRKSKFPLQLLPELGDCYADLRVITAIDRRFLDAERRLAQLSPAGVIRLQAQLVGFFTGLSDEALERLLSQAADATAAASAGPQQA
jgi:hypothetical protein